MIKEHVKASSSVWWVSILKKYLMGLTGLGLALFVLLHMLGNLFIFAGDKAYNLYMHQMVNMEASSIIQVGLLSAFLLHIILAFILSVKNYFSRLKKYARAASGWKATAWYQKGLIAQGAVILVFVILHLITFKFGVHYKINYGNEEIRDLFRLVVEAFQNPITVVWYIVALLVLFIHLFHGLSSSFQSLGLNHPRFNKSIKGISLVYAVLVTVGYISLPLYVFLFMQEGAG